MKLQFLKKKIQSIPFSWKKQRKHNHSKICKKAFEIHLIYISEHTNCFKFDRARFGFETRDSHRVKVRLTQFYKKNKKKKKTQQTRSSYSTRLGFLLESKFLRSKTVSTKNRQKKQERKKESKL